MHVCIRVCMLAQFLLLSVEQRLQTSPWKLLLRVTSSFQVVPESVICGAWGSWGGGWVSGLELTVGDSHARLGGRCLDVLF